MSAARRRRRRRRKRISARLIGVLLLASGVAGGIAGRVAHHLDEQAKKRPEKANAAEPVVVQHVIKPFEVVESIYDSRLGAGWEDWGGGRHDLTTVGPARVVFGGYAGIVFHHADLSSDFGALAFRFKAPPTWAPFLAASVGHTQAPEGTFPRVDLKPVDLADAGDGWKEAFIEWPRLNPKNLPIDRVVISASRQVGPDSIELDKVALTKRVGPPREAPVRDVDLAMVCDAQAVPISPMIYGITMSAWGSGATAHRIGGNPSSRLNWDLGAVWNAGKDWFFENASGKGSVAEWVTDATAHHAVTALTVPMIGWVAKDTISVGFPTSKFGKQHDEDPNRPEAGDGIALDGTKLKPGPPTETSVPAPPEKIAKWISALRAKDRLLASRSVLMYILDNEPSLWSEVHRDVHPQPLTQDELLDRTVQYATAIRKADPETPIAGPAEWGWTGYFFSGRDREVGTELRPDRRAHGDIPLVAWYLKKLAEREKTAGGRLLDVLDLHFYPQGERIFGTNARTDAEGAALRLRSTRALWDPDYVDESWIHEPVRLIPRMREWVAQNYPGTKTSIGEWSFGADDHISGALATAEALGRFGQQQLDSAFYWGGPQPNTRAFWAFRAFRDFDGRGGHFLDWSVPTHEAERVSFFASRDEAGDHLVAVILNLDPKFAVRARIETSSCGKIKSRRAFSYTEDTPSLKETPGLTGEDGLVEVIPPYSIRVLDLSASKANREDK